MYYKFYGRPAVLNPPLTKKKVKKIFLIPSPRFLASFGESICCKFKVTMTSLGKIKKVINELN
jgi:hypothetical protein